MTAQPTVLLATNYLYGWTGSETLMLTLIGGLRAQGCALTVFARHLDPVWAAEQCGPDIMFTDDPAELRDGQFDLAHVQHSSCLMDIRAAFPTLPIVFSSLGVLPFLEQPPPFDCGISTYLAISEEVRDNLIVQGIPSERIEILRNLVNTARFAPAAPIRPKPQRILVISNKINDAKLLLLRAAARRIGASLRIVGGTHGALPQDRLAAAINEADVVVSLGRGVIEAMLCGRVPLVFDIQGSDGLVTPDNFDELRASNFSGRRLRREYTITELVDELGKYRTEYGERLRELALAQFGLDANLPCLLEIYAEAGKARPHSGNEPLDTIAFCARLTREELQYVRQREAHLQLTLDNLLNELHRIKHTVSWQITKPLRAIWNLFGWHLRSPASRR